MFGDVLLLINLRCDVISNARSATLRAATLLVGMSVAALSACASQRVETIRPPVARKAVALSREELRDTAHTNLYDLILARRPFWLMSRTFDRGAPVSEVQVLLDNQRLVSVNELRTLDPAAMHLVGYVDPSARNRGYHIGLRSESGLMIVQSYNPMGGTTR
ncbi:hypothetical protein [Gemmatimonas sp.]|uniref:hypothetical protein n=1 Tax=Gemmatimonas sp. TaxID=1962908 RepID=UPI0037BEDAB5